MNIKRLTQSFYIFTHQLSLADLAEIKKLGIKTIITNRPDGEIANQPSFKTIKESAKKIGINAVYIPVLSSGMTSQNIADFSAAIEHAEKLNQTPIIAYCRTATRSTRLWSLSQLNKMPASKIKNIASAAGYDVSNLIK